MPDKFRAVTQPLNVVGTVVVEASPWVEDNQWLLDLAKATPEIVGIVGNLNLREPAFAKDLKRFAANPLYRGLRVNIDTVRLNNEEPVSSHLSLMADTDLSLDVIGKGVVLPFTEQVGSMSFSISSDLTESFTRPTGPSANASHPTPWCKRLWQTTSAPKVAKWKNVISGETPTPPTAGSPAELRLI